MSEADDTTRLCGVVFDVAGAVGKVCTKHVDHDGAHMGMQVTRVDQASAATEPEGFTRNVSVDSDKGCWLWTGTITPNGYGRFTWKRRTLGAHRFAYEWFVGPIPEGLHVDHLCRVRRCVNPAHLEAVTQEENNVRAGRVKTHCPQGHEYTPENTRYVHGGRHRQCRACDRENGRVNMSRYRAKRRAKA